MLNFESDYTEGAHEDVLARLIETNRIPLSGYGSDCFTESAEQKIKSECRQRDAQVFLLTGGTQTNQIVIDTMLASYEGVVAADTGHISSHEAGAIEYTGHKVLALPNSSGKLSSSELENYMQTFNADENHDHTVFPGMVYISHPTEYGTLYTKDELSALSDVCRRYGLSLYLDGARLGYGLMSDGTDVTLQDIASLCDVFYIGGTKVGALCGEAVVFTHNNAPKHFFTSIKQHGALLAKGRLLGVQFDALFTSGLYYKISRHAIEMANRIRQALKEKGYRFLIETSTNQIFIVLEDAQLQELRREVKMSFWEKIDNGHTAVRIATSWATRESDVDALIEVL